MSRGLTYGLVASLLLWPPVAASIAACLRVLPKTDPVNPLLKSHDEFHNWVGQGFGTVLMNALALVAAVYAAKYLVGHLPARWMRVYAFALLVAASLPYLWLLVETDWRNIHIYRVCCWVYGPVGFWAIPAGSFAADTIALRTPRLLPYLARSALEVQLMVPWRFAWSFVEFWVLGGGWI